MLKKILVAVDGSGHSKKVLQRAATMAVADGSEVVVLHAIRPNFLSEEELAYAQEHCGEKFSRLVAGSFLPQYPIDGEAEDRSIEDFMTARDKFYEVYGEEIIKNATKILEEAGVQKITFLSENGEPAKVILDVAKRENVDLIIIGRRGQNAIAEFFLGSTATRVVQYADRSVLTVE